MEPRNEPRVELIFLPSHAHTHTQTHTHTHTHTCTHILMYTCTVYYRYSLVVQQEATGSNKSLVL